MLLRTGDKPLAPLTLHAEASVFFVGVQCVVWCAELLTPQVVQVLRKFVERVFAYVFIEGAQVALLVQGHLILELIAKVKAAFELKARTLSGVVLAPVNQATAVQVPAARRAHNKYSC